VSEREAGGPDAAGRIGAVRARIAAAARRAGRDPAVVRLVAVSKTVEAARIRPVVAAGVRDLGENRAQELLAKVPDVPGATWHFVGRLQRNKVRALAPHVALWHSVDRPELGPVLARHAPGARVLVQVNVGADPAKGGCPRGEAPGLVAELAGAGLEVAGLMTVPPLGEDPRPHFAALRALASRLGLPELSMGMSDDLEVAVEEGATLVRVGRALFGPRPGPDDPRR
jgi:hypothetical protein